jgi:hypothetical protein
MPSIHSLHKANQLEPRKRIRRLTGLLFAAVLFYGGCKTVQEHETGDLDIAQSFIRHCNTNHFDEAAALLEPGEENRKLLEAAQRKFAAKPAKAMEKARSADIIVHEMQSTGENERLLLYTTSDEPDNRKKLRLVRTAGNWKVSLLSSN